MTEKEKVLFMFQAAFGLPILAWSLWMMYEDAIGNIHIDRIGYAFFGGIVSHFLSYFFRKAIKKE